jgi:hypothetical protein
MVKQMAERAQQMKRESTILQRSLSMTLDGGGAEQTQTAFSLALCSAWEKAGDQKFFDLHQLVKSGVPSVLRYVVWGDLMKTGILEAEEKKNLNKMQHQHYQPGLSVFEHFELFQQQYDSVAFRQIDEDIRDFKFPAYYYEETIDQSQQNSSEDSSSVYPTERVNKLVYDKQQMRKLMRILLVWGKSI